MNRCWITIMLCLTLAGLGAAGCGRGSGGQHFGEPFTASGLTPLAELRDSPEAFHRQTIRVRGVIERQCPASGCWFFLRDESNHSIRVDLGDTLPRLPQNVGNTAEVEGEWIRRGDRYEFIGTRVTFTKKGAGR